MRKFEVTAKAYNQLQKQMVTECREFLTNVAKVWNGKAFPLSKIYREFDMEDAYCCIIYDGGRHPEYASNVCSEVESLYLKDGEPLLSIEDCDAYSFDRVENDDIITIAFAVDNSIDFMIEELLNLTGIESTTENGVWTISREDWDRLVDIAEGRDDLNRYLDDETDDTEWLEDMAACYNPKAFVTLISHVAYIGKDKVTWSWV